MHFLSAGARRGRFNDFRVVYYSVYAGIICSWWPVVAGGRINAECFRHFSGILAVTLTTFTKTLFREMVEVSFSELINVSVTLAVFFIISRIPSALGRVPYVAAITHHLWSNKKHTGRVN